MNKVVYGSYLKAKSILRSVKSMSQVHLGDDVIYDGKLCFVNNGVSAPTWDLCETSFKKDGTRNCYRVHEDNFRKAWTYYNLKNGLFSLHRWYMNYWYDIDLRKKIKETS